MTQNSIKTDGLADRVLQEGESDLHEFDEGDDELFREDNLEFEYRSSLRENLAEVELGRFFMMP